MPSVTEKQDKKYGDHDNLGKSPEERQSEVDRLNDDFSAPAFGEEPNVKAAEASGNTGAAKTKADSNEQSQLNGAIKFRNEDEGKEKSKGKGFFASRKGKWLTGGGIGGALIGIIIGMFMAIPLKVLGIANNLQGTFFSSSEEATEDMTDRLLRSYIVQRVMPGMMDGKCTSTKASRSCAAVSPGQGPISTLYNAWKDAKLENTLATKHGIIIERSGNKFRLITPSTLSTKGVDLGSFDASNASAMDSRLGTQMSRTDVRREVRGALEKETFGKRIMYHYKVGRLLERKYGIQRCLVACSSRDKVTGKVEAKKAAFKSYFIERVVTPRSEMMGTAMLCAINGFNCTNRSEEADAHGERPSEFETEIQTRARERIGTYNEGDMDELSRRTEGIRTKGFTYTFISTFVGEGATKLGAKAIPIVGWIDLAANLFTGAEKIGPSIKKMNYVINSSAMVTTYMMYRTNADEIKTGNVDTDLVGSVVSSLSTADGKERTDQGGVSAEATPYYSALMGAGQAKSTALAPFSNTVYAAGNSQYKCDDGNSVPAGKLVCPEEQLINPPALKAGISGISDVANSGPLKPLGLLAGFWTSTAGVALDKAGDALSGVIGLMPRPDIIDTLQAKLGEVMAVFMKTYVINNVVSDNPSGGRNFDMAAGGADVAGNDFCHYGLGCQQVTQQQANAIRQERQQDELDSFKSQSMFARMFDTTSSHSLVSKLAMAIPGSSVTSISQSAALTLSNPTSILHGFGSSSTVSAASVDEDPMGVTQYAYPRDTDKIFTDDPQATWDRLKCDDPATISEWGKKSTTNPDTGMEEHNEPNPCQLIQASVGMACGVFSDSCLTDEDLNGVTGGSGEGGISVMSWNLCRQDADCGNLTSLSDSQRADLNTEQFAKTLPDIAGLQEADQIADKLKKSPAVKTNYGIFESGTRSILWKKSLLSKTTKDGTFDMSAGRDNMPWVQLKSVATGKEFYVIDIHTQVASGSARTIDANKTVDLINSKLKDAPVIIIGDMNSQYPGHDSGHKGNEVYDVFKKAGYLLTFNAALKKINDDCQTSHSFEVQCGDKNGSHIDHIWVANAPGTVVNSWELIKNETTQKASDHRPIIVQLAIPGLSGTEETSSTGYKWPIAKADYVPLTNCFAKPGHTGIDIPVPSGTKVLASSAGKVVQTGGPGGDGGNYIVIDHGNGKFTNYQHLSEKKVTTGSSVTSGQVIGLSGYTGYVIPAGARGAHLHFSVTTKGYLDSRNTVSFSLNPLDFLPKDRDLGSCK